MRLAKKYKNGFPAVIAVAVLLVSAFLPGCNNQGCTDNHNALPLMGFYTIDADDNGNLSEQAVSLDSVDIGGVGAPGDSLLVAAGTRVGSLYLPFRHDYKQISFFFRYKYKEQGLDKPEFNDTITFSYDSDPYFASEECGAMYKYRVRGVTYTRHLIDSLAVSDSVITNVERERLKVYFRVANLGGGTDLGTLDVPEDPDRLGELELLKAVRRGKGGGL